MRIAPTPSPLTTVLLARPLHPRPPAHRVPAFPTYRLRRPLECPMLWKCNDKCEKFTDILKNKLMMKNWYVRGTLYALLSILMFSGSVYCIIAGLVMDVMAISYIFAEFQGLRETSEDEAAYAAA